MSQVGYYAVIIALGVANLVLGLVAWHQRRVQIRGNRLREQQVSLAELRNEMAGQRLSLLRDQAQLLAEIRDSLAHPGPGPPTRLMELREARAKRGGQSINK